MRRDHTIGQLCFPLEVEGFQEHIQLEIILQDSTRAYYKKRVNPILTQKKRGINWILPVAPCGDDIQLYLFGGGLGQYAGNWNTDKKSHRGANSKSGGC